MSGTLQKQINLKKSGPDTYSASWHQDWTVASTLHGGTVAAVIHHAAVTHMTTDPTLLARNQPDVLNLHIRFLRACERLESTITVSSLQVGAAACTLQLQLVQKGQVRVIALATSTNFERPLGPTAPTAWKLYPQPGPKPDFDRILSNQPEDNWIPARQEGEVVPLTRRLLVLDPRDGFHTEGTCDSWNGFLGDERMDATYIALMADIVPSMSDTLMRTGGMYNAHQFWQKAKDWAESNPGTPAVFRNSLAEIMKSAFFSSTVVLDIEYRRRLPREGLRFTFTRTTARSLQDGRLDLDVTICNEDLEVVCTSHQLILVLEAQRKFRGSKAGNKL